MVSVSLAFPHMRETMGTGIYASVGTSCAATAANRGTNGSSQTGNTVRVTPTVSQGGATAVPNTTATADADLRSL